MNPSQSQSATARLFLAIEPDAATRAALAEATQPLKQVDGLKLIPTANLHVTVKFLGDVAEQAVDDITAALELAVEGIAPFTMQIERVIPLPDARRPRVLAAAFDKPALLSLLHERIEQMLSELGYEPERRPFRPHVTLGRFRRPPRGILPAVNLPEECGFLVRQIVLMRSELQPAGPIYRPLACMGLGG